MKDNKVMKLSIIRADKNTVSSFNLSKIYKENKEKVEAILTKYIKDLTDPNEYTELKFISENKKDLNLLRKNTEIYKEYEDMYLDKELVYRHIHGYSFKGFIDSKLDKLCSINKLVDLASRLLNGILIDVTVDCTSNIFLRNIVNLFIENDLVKSIDINGSLDYIYSLKGYKMYRDIIDGKWEDINNPNEFLIIDNPRLVEFIESLWVNELYKGNRTLFGKGLLSIIKLADDSPKNYFDNNQQLLDKSYLPYVDNTIRIYDLKDILEDVENKVVVEDYKIMIEVI